MSGLLLGAFLSWCPENLDTWPGFSHQLQGNWSWQPSAVRMGPMDSFSMSWGYVIRPSSQEGLPLRVLAYPFHHAATVQRQPRNLERLAGSPVFLSWEMSREHLLSSSICSFQTPERMWHRAQRSCIDTSEEIRCQYTDLLWPGHERIEKWKKC